MTARILVVDDIVANIKLLTARLTSEYYVVLTATCGEEAIKIASEQSPDIILLDVMMPKMNGFDVCKILKADPKTSYIPIVMVTALKDTQDKLNGLNAGADDFLTKPINDIKLMTRIRSLTRYKTLIDELRLREQFDGNIKSAIDKEILNYSHDVSDASVLIIDNDTLRIKHISAILQKEFKNIVTSTSTEQGLAIGIKSIQDLIIVNSSFDDDDTAGFKLCSQLRSNIETRHTPLLLMLDEDYETDDMNYLVKAYELGFNDYINIPIDDNELLARATLQVKRKRYQDALRMRVDRNLQMSVIDPLTECYNRRYFDMYLSNVLNSIKEKKQSISIIMIDIDHFKKVNDEYGHSTGDELLKAIRSRISSVIKLTDCLARFGGEEFIIVTTGLTPTQTSEIATRIRTNINGTPFKLSDKLSLTKTISIGTLTVQYRDDRILDAKNLIELCDKCLYEAKETGRDRVVSRVLE